MPFRTSESVNRMSTWKGVITNLGMMTICLFTFRRTGLVVDARHQIMFHVLLDRKSQGVILRVMRSKEQAKGTGNTDAYAIALIVLH